MKGEREKERIKKRKRKAMAVGGFNGNMEVVYGKKQLVSCGPSAQRRFLSVVRMIHLKEISGENNGIPISYQIRRSKSLWTMYLFLG